MMGDEEIRRAFEVVATTPQAWRVWALEHKRAMDLLWPANFAASFGMLSMAMTHAGQALENLREGREAYEATVRPRSTDAGLKAGVAVNAEEQALLRRLTPFVVWAGRYPTPIAADKDESNAIYSDDNVRITQLVERLTAELSARVAKAR